VFSEPIGDFDVLFHLAAYVRTEDDADDVRINDTGTRWLLEQLGDRLRHKHVVFTSSISAVDSTCATDGWMNEQTECRPRTEYGRSKLNAEEIIAAESVRLGFTYTILRLPIVSGPGYRPQGIFGFYRDQLPRKTFGARLAWPGKISLVEVGDAANILAQVAVRDEMRGQTFFVSSAEDPCMSEMAQVSADCLGVTRKPVLFDKRVFDLMNAAGKWLARARLLPHSLRILGWRVSLVADGYCCDGSALTRLLDMQYMPWKDSFRRMYKLPAATARTPRRLRRNCATSRTQRLKSARRCTQALTTEEDVGSIS
jgi:nucleoside-diphosphate-sugar epimerase